MRPVDQAPLAVQGLDVTVAGTQVVDETLEHAVVVEQLQARLVVHLEPDHRRVVAYRATTRRITRSAVSVIPLIALFLALQRLWRADLLAGALTG